ncbi:FERM domain-containing protein 4A-like isoform X2 [Limulus polyphemus]|uniref:FERM domain-containing protein 4A-like isoform X2 n=1 Tax=Limulus polyphemus TaxID=6850 RepID=A0ABM1SH89_LIMPO|nr:FERM domain-containing protein 4A-like isoform X2 [Limulus polyphemus]
MSIVESLPTYGIHYYEVKDKAGIPWWLGLNYKGISQYDFIDRKNPRKIFPWKHLDNLYFRDRKFSIEVHSPRRVSVSRRTFGPGNVTVYVWFAINQALTKCIWSMAVAQHQFYLDKKHCKSRVSIVRSLGDIANDLSRSIHSLSSASSSSNLSHSASLHSLSSLKTEGEQSEEIQLFKQDMLAVLKARKEALEEALKKKKEDLRILCIKEGELTGELPPEIPLAPGELPPTVKQSAGQTLTIVDKLITKAKSKEEEALGKLELQYEIQSKITNAALQLVNDFSAKKTVRKQRRTAYQQAQTKLEDLEQRLEILRKQAEAVQTKKNKQSSDGEASEDNLSQSTDENEIVFPDKTVDLSDLDLTLSPRPTKLEETNNQVNRVLTPNKVPSPVPSSSSSSLQLSATSMGPSSAPPTPTKPRHCHAFHINGSSTLPSANPFSRSSSSRGSSHSLCNQRPKIGPMYHSRPSSHTEHYTRSGSQSTVGSDSYDNVSAGGGHGPFLQSPYQNRFESSLNLEGSNLYSVPTQRTSQAFSTQDDILALNSSEIQDLGLMSRHNSLETRHRSSVRQRKARLASEGLPSRPTMNISPSYDERLCHLRTLEEGQRTVNNIFHHHHNSNHHHYYQHPKKHHSSSKPDSQSLGCLDYHPNEDYPVFDNPSSSLTETTEHSFSENKLGNSPLVQSVAQYNFVENLRVSIPELNRNVKGRRHWLMDSQCVQQIDQKTSPISVYLNTLSPKLHRDIDVYDDCNLGQFSLKNAQTQDFPVDCSQTLSPKPKTKDWLETSLDSPLPPRKSRSMESQNRSSGNTHLPVIQVTAANAELKELVNLPQQEEERVTVLPGTQVGMPQVPAILQSPSWSNTEKTLSPHKALIMENCMSFSPPPPSFSVHKAGVEVNVVSIGRFQPSREETKPYEISDFYKYSTKHRKQTSIMTDSYASESNLQVSVNGQQTGQANFATEMLVGPEPDSTMSQLSPIVPVCFTRNQEYGDQFRQVSPQKDFCQPLLYPQAQSVYSPSSSIPVNVDISCRFTENTLTPESSFSFERSASCISLAQDFHEEMLAWYEDQDNVKNATLV